MPFAQVDRIRLRFHEPRIAVYPPGATFGPRRQGDFQFVWLIEGDAVWTVDGVDHPVPEGAVALGRPGQVDAFRWDPRRRTRHGWVAFTVDLGGARMPEPLGWPLVRQPDRGDVILPLLDHMAWLCQSQRPGWQVLAESALRHALLAFAADAAGTAGAAIRPPQPMVAQALAWVRSGGRCRPVDLARAAGVSLGHLHRTFRQEFGVTLMTAVRLVRLDRVAQLLAGTDLTLHAIADDVGFASPFHCSRAFTAAYGLSPRDFRKRIAAGGGLPPMRLVRHEQVVSRTRAAPDDAPGQEPRRSDAGRSG
jgi:AraC-like DNA-binding protein